MINNIWRYECFAKLWMKKGNVTKSKINEIKYIYCDDGEERNGFSKDRSRRRWNRDYNDSRPIHLAGWSGISIKSASEAAGRDRLKSVSNLSPPPLQIRRRNNNAGCYDNRAASRRIASHRAKPARKLALLHHNDFSLVVAPPSSLPLLHTPPILRPGRTFTPLPSSRLEISLSRIFR